MRPDDDLFPRPVTGFFDSLTPERQDAALAYRGPENIGSDEFRLVAVPLTSGPSTSTHAGAGEERQRRTREAMEALAEVDADEICELRLGKAHLDAFHEWATSAGVESDQTVSDATDLIEEDGYMLRLAVASIYAAAGKMMADAGPIPLTAGVPWEEPNTAYSRRMGIPFTSSPSPNIATEEREVAVTRTLNQWGARQDLPRARLVLVEW